MGSAAVVPPPPRKFCRVYHLTTAEYAISNIVFKRIKIARFSQLNDPFELLGPRRMVRLSSGTLKDVKTSLDENYGVVCFSENWTDPVLWSHYAAQHRGICLGFDVARSKLREVHYTSERIPLATLKVMSEAKIRDTLIRTKFESWSYEREKRVLIPFTEAKQEGPLYFLSMGPDLQLAEVILGVLCSIDLAMVAEVVDHHHPDVVTFQSRLADNTFSIVPKESTVPELD
jgi:hypothetical protein